MSFLRKIFKKKPRYFKVPISEQSAVPPFFLEALARIEACPPREGLWRVPGSVAEVMRLRQLIESGRKCPLDSIPRNTVVSLVKRYLSEMPEPILTGLRTKLHSAVAGSSACCGTPPSDSGDVNKSPTTQREVVVRSFWRVFHTDCSPILRELVSSLFGTTSRLCVPEICSVTLMDSKKVALVFAPNLMGNIQREDMAVIRHLIDDYDAIFGSEEPHNIPDKEGEEEKEGGSRSGSGSGGSGDFGGMLDSPVVDPDIQESIFETLRIEEAEFAEYYEGHHEMEDIPYVVLIDGEEVELRILEDVDPEEEGYLVAEYFDSNGDRFQVEFIENECSFLDVGDEPPDDQECHIENFLADLSYVREVVTDDDEEEEEEEGEEVAIQVGRQQGQHFEGESEGEELDGEYGYDTRIVGDGDEGRGGEGEFEGGFLREEDVEIAGFGEEEDGERFQDDFLRVEDGMLPDDYVRADERFQDDFVDEMLPDGFVGEDENDGRFPDDFVRVEDEMLPENLNFGDQEDVGDGVDHDPEGFRDLRPEEEESSDEDPIEYVVEDYGDESSSEDEDPHPLSQFFEDKGEFRGPGYGFPKDFDGEEKQQSERKGNIVDVTYEDGDSSGF